jgi:hypothetical protein
MAVLDLSHRDGSEKTHGHGLADISSATEHGVAGYWRDVTAT